MVDYVYGKTPNELVKMMRDESIKKEDIIGIYFDGKNHLCYYFKK